MTADAAAPALKPSIWRRLWNLLQAAEMSSAEYQHRRIDALARRVDALQGALQERAPGPSEALGPAVSENR